LEVRTREQVPLAWASTQHRLGSTLQTIGERESEPTRLQEAIAAYSEALKERTLEKSPILWATTFGNQGIALMHLAERTKNAAMAETASSQIAVALENMRASGQDTVYYETRLSEARRIQDVLSISK
jgi:hypothetical protein